MERRLPGEDATWIMVVKMEIIVVAANLTEGNGSWSTAADVADCMYLN